MKGKLWAMLVLVVIAMLLLPALALAQDTIGERCVIVEGPSRTELGITGPQATIGGVRNVQVTGPQIRFNTEAGAQPLVILPAVQYPPDPC